MPIDAREFVRTHTTVRSPPLCPELRLHLGGDAIPLWEATEKLLGRSNLPPPYWAYAWPGGQALARFVLDHPELVAGKRVVDFASGSGVSAIAAKRAGASKITATEIDPLAVAAMELNSEANGVELELVSEDVTRGDGGWDVVLAGDVCYERPMAERVTNWLANCSGRGATVLMGDPGRNYLPGRGLVEVARYTVPTSRDLEDRDVRETVVWRVVGPAALGETR